MPQLVIAPKDPDEQYLPIKLRLTKINSFNTYTYSALLSQERQNSELFLIPSLMSCLIDRIEFRVIPATKARAALTFCSALLKSPRLLVRSLQQQNLGYAFVAWPAGITKKARFRSLVELASRNMPDPDSLNFGVDPEYTLWINNNYETLIPRRYLRSRNRIGNDNRTIAIIYGSASEKNQFALTINSLIGAGMAFNHIFADGTIAADEALQQQSSLVRMVSEIDFFKEASTSEPTDCLMILNAGDIVSRDIFEILAQEKRARDSSVVYFDHDFVSGDGTFHDYCFKPDTSPVNLVFNNYISRASIVRAETIQKKLADYPNLTTLGFGSFLYSAVLELALTNKSEISHIPKPVFHLTEIRDQEEERALATDQIVRETILRKYVPDLKVEGVGRSAAKWSSKKQLQDKVTIIIPTRNRVDLLRPAVVSVANLTQYPNCEIVVIDNLSNDPDTLAYLGQLQNKGVAKIVRFDEEFNFAKMHNHLVEDLSTDFVLLLNNDTEVIDPQWLTKMIELFLLPKVGIVGNKLVYPDKTIQHIGATGGLRGPMSHHLRGSVDTELSNIYLKHPRNLLGVTGACLLIPKLLYLESGGMDERLAVSYNDMDLCLSVQVKLDKSVVVSSYGGVIHKESKSRGSTLTKDQQQLLNDEANYFDKKWSKYIRPDPFYNPNLSLERDYELK